ncbi:MAG: hypothetical protein SOV59_02240 [Fusobacterium mortiferum]|nr:hypothetical protein [Fusobacterium mortiferum]
MEKMEKYLEKKKNEKNDTFEQILEKDREDVSKECERDAKKKQKKYNFDELKKIGLDLTPYKEDYPEFFKKIIELFIKLKNEEQKNIYSGLKSNLELNQDIILNSSCFSEIKEAYENLKDEISIDYTNYYRMLNLNSTLPILSYERRNMQHLIEEFKKIREFKIPLREDVSSINEALKIFDEKQKIQIFNFIYGILIEKKVEDFEKYKEEWFEIICDKMNFRNQYKENFYMIASKIWKYNSIKIRKKILQMVISFEEIDDEIEMDKINIISCLTETISEIAKADYLRDNHKQIIALFIEKLLHRFSKNIPSEENNTINLLLAVEIYLLVDFTIENIYNSKILKNLSRELLENTKQKLEKFEKIKKNYIENKLKKSKNDNVSKDETYWEKISLSIAFSVLFFNLKSIELENTKSLYNKVSENKFELNIDTNKELELNTEILEKIKYKEIKSNKKQPNDFKERIEIIKKLIIDLNKYDNGVQCPTSKETIIFLYLIIYLTDEYNFNNLKLKSYVNSIDFEKKDVEYFLFISELKNIIIQSFSIIAKDKEAMAIIIEIREILIRFLKFILNIPVPQLSNLILKEFLKELNNILE